MWYFDFIQGLRKGEPNLDKAVKWMKIAGWVCVGAAVWNGVLPRFMEKGRHGFRLPAHYDVIVPLLLLRVAALFFASSKALRRSEESGVWLGQWAVGMLAAGFIVLMAVIVPFDGFIPGRGFTRLFFGLFYTLFFAQFLVPAYYLVRYLGRLHLGKRGGGGAPPA